eukprot:g2629.t1
MLASIARTALRRSTRSLHGSVARLAEEAAAAGAAAENVTLNFALPHEAIYEGAIVDQVILPGEAGEYGVTAGHTPNITQLKPGVMQIHHEKDDKEPETYFISGGFAVTHENSTTDVSAIEAVKLDDLDAAAAQAGYAEAKSAYDTASDDSAEKAEAQIAMETYAAVADALGSSVA